MIAVNVTQVMGSGKTIETGTSVRLMLAAAVWWKRGKREVIV